MERIGIRDLRQHASQWLTRVKAGESFEVTDRGRPIATLSPWQEADSDLDRLVRSGEIRPPVESDPLPRRPASSRGPSASEVLAGLRAEEAR